MLLHMVQPIFNSQTFCGERVGRQVQLQPCFRLLWPGYTESWPGYTELTELPQAVVPLGCFA